MQIPLRKAAVYMRWGAAGFGVLLTGWIAYSTLHQQPNLQQTCNEYRASYLAGFEQTQAMWRQWPLLLFGLVCTVTGFAVIVRQAKQQLGRGARIALHFTGYPSRKPLISKGSK